MSFQEFIGGELRFRVRCSRTGSWRIVSSKAEKATGIGTRQDDRPLQPPPIDLDRYEKWRTGDRVDTADLFRQLHDYFASWFATPEPHVLVLLTVYTMLTYVYTAVDEVPYLAFEGEPDAGKTQVAKLLNKVCFNPVLSAGVTSSAIPRIIQRSGGTLLLDEQNPDSGTWGDILRAGYRAGLNLIISDQRSDSVISRPVFGPKVMFTNEPLRNAALASRTLRVVLLSGQAAPNRFVQDEVERRAEPLRTELVLFALQHVLDLRARCASIPNQVSLHNRDMDLAVLPLAIASLVDEAPGSTTNAVHSLTAYLSAASVSRKRAFRDEAVRPVLARSILAMKVPSDQLVKSDEFTAFVNASNLLPRKLSSREVGRLLNRYGLVLERKVQNDPEALKELTNSKNSGSTNPDDKQPRVQKQFYRLDVERARGWVTELEAAA